MGKTKNFWDKHHPWLWTQCKCKYPEPYNTPSGYWSRFVRCRKCDENIGKPLYTTSSQLQKRREKRDTRPFGFSKNARQMGPKFKGGYDMNSSCKGKLYRDTLYLDYQVKECVVCYNRVKVEENNKVYCKDTEHILCTDCKTKISNNKNNSCPLCRSHTIKPPIYQRVEIELNHRCYRDSKKVYYYEYDSDDYYYDSD